MSNWANVILSFCAVEGDHDEAWEEIRQHLDTFDWRHTGWKEVAETGHVLATQINHCPEEQLRAFIAAMPWECPEDVQLFIQHEEDFHFALWQLTDARVFVRVTDGDRSEETRALLAEVGRLQSALVALDRLVRHRVQRVLFQQVPREQYAVLLEGMARDYDQWEEKHHPERLADLEPVEEEDTP